MTVAQKQILTESYNQYKNGKRGTIISFVDASKKEKQSILVSLEYLEEKGLVKTIHSAGFIESGITSKGIDFIENDFVESTMNPIIQGNNSIYVSGSNNAISDNYNSVIVNINNSNLPDETKLLIETFLQEMKNPKFSQESKSEKIKQFLCDITSGTLSGLATNGLAVLLSSVFSQL